MAGLFALLLTVTLASHAWADVDLPLPYYGYRGGAFRARCAEGELLTGVELRAGSDVDAIRLLCAVASGPQSTTATSLGSGWHGGGGGSLVKLACPSDLPIVIGMDIQDESHSDLILVDSIHLYCGQAITGAQRTPFPNAVFDGLNDGVRQHPFDQRRCPAGLVGVGIYGRSGEYLDNLSLTCGEPRWAPVQAEAPAKPTKPEPVKAQARVKPGAGATSSPSNLSICERTRQARARNSPAAPGLEAQCHDMPMVPEPPIDLAALHARGVEIANPDRDAGRLRDQQREGPDRRGF